MLVFLARGRVVDRVISCFCREPMPMAQFVRAMVLHWMARRLRDSRPARIQQISLSKPRLGYGFARSCHATARSPLRHSEAILARPLDAYTSLGYLWFSPIGGEVPNFLAWLQSGVAKASARPCAITTKTKPAYAGQKDCVYTMAARRKALDQNPIALIATL